MISKRSLFRKYSLQCFHRVTQSVMALWDTDTGTRFVQGHLASVQKVMGDIIAKKVFFRKHWFFEVKYQIPPPSLDQSFMRGHCPPLSRTTEYPKSWVFGEVQGTRITAGFQKVAISQLTEIYMQLSSLRRAGRRDLCYHQHLSNGCSLSQVAALEQSSSSRSKCFEAWACLNVWLKYLYL